MTRLFQILLLALCFFATAHAADRPPLHEAARNGDMAKVEALLAQGANVNDKDSNGETALNWAIANSEKSDIVELLLARGADVKNKAQHGETPLHGAVHLGRKNIAELLLAKGADVNAMSKYGTPLHYAINARRKDMVELLLTKNADIYAKGIDVRARDKNGWTPREEAAELGLNDIVTQLDKHVLMLEEHLLQQASLNPRDALVQLTGKLKGNPDDNSTRRLIVKLASRIKPAPAIPEEARRHFVEGSTIVKAGKNPAEQALAAQSFTEALKAAPWWPDAYYNLAVAQDLAGQFDDAEKSFTLYILSNPGEAEQREAQDRIYALSAKRKLSK